MTVSDQTILRVLEEHGVAFGTYGYGVSSFPAPQRPAAGTCRS